MRKNSNILNQRRVSTALTIVLLFFAGIAASGVSMSKSEILATFKQYLSLNEELSSSVASGHSNSGKPYDQLRKEIEAFAAVPSGPFQQALNAAEHVECTRADAEILQGLFRVIIATSNSADESPAATLTDIYFCQSNFLENQFKLLQSSEQRQVYENLKFGFEIKVAY